MNGTRMTIWSVAAAALCWASCGGNVVVDGTPAGTGGMHASTTTGTGGGVTCGGTTCAAGMMCCVSGCGTCAPMVTGACTLLDDCGG